MKKLIAALLALVLVFGMVACTSSAPQTETSTEPQTETTEKAPEAVNGNTIWTPSGKQDGFKVALSTANFGNTWASTYVADFEAIAQEYKSEGIIADYQIATSEHDLTQQINSCTALINSGIDCLLLWPVSAEGVKPIVDLAQQSGVLVIICNDPAAYEGTYGVFGNNDAMMQILTEWMVIQLGGKGNIVEITGVPGHPADTPRIAVVDGILAQHPDINVLASAPGNWTPTDAQAAMTTFLSTYDNIDGVLAQDVMSDGILKAYDNAGKTPTLITGDYVKSYIDAWAARPDLNSITVSYDPGIVVTALEFAVNVLQGKTFKDGALVENPADTALVNCIISDPAYVVTRDGDANAPWMEGLVGTKAITLEEAVELLKDKQDVDALDGWMSREEVGALFN